MRPEFKWGLIMGASLCLWIIAEYYFGLHTPHVNLGQYPGYLSNLVPVAGLFLLLREKQSTAFNGHLDLSQGLVAGLAASFIGALIVYGFMLAYNQWINPDWVDNALAVKVAALRAQGIDEIKIRGEITFFRHANGPFGMLASTLLTLTITGGIISFFLTLLLRRQPRIRAV